MASLLPSVLKRFDMSPAILLDLACGEGTFAVAAAKMGFTVTGLDISPQMLELARTRAEEGKVDVEFIGGDMRSLDFSSRFDLVTCWYDSLNYILRIEGLLNTFAGVCRALRPGGLFVFDMNTIHGLVENWRESPCYIQQDSDGIFEVHSCDYDFDTNIATMKITGFLRDAKAWDRIEEQHKERGYRLDDVEMCLKESGLDRLACWENPQKMTEPRPTSGRLWFVTKKST
jgi:ubiquinone/menaquinone biosynthesis C-methylase UbiE